MTAHPQATPLLSPRKWLTPHGMAVIECGMGEMTDAGMDAHRAVLAMNATGLFLPGLAGAITGSDGADLLAAIEQTGRASQFGHAPSAGSGGQPAH